MQKRHFEFIAKTIKIMTDRKAAEYATTVFQAALASTNDKFDGAKFRKACGV